MTKKYCTFHGSWSKGYVGESTRIHKVKGSKTICGLSIKKANRFLDEPVVWFNKKANIPCSTECSKCFKT